MTREILVIASYKSHNNLMDKFPEPQILQNLRKFFFDVATPSFKPASFQVLRALGAPSQFSTGEEGQGFSLLLARWFGHGLAGGRGCTTRFGFQLLAFGLEAHEPGKSVLVQGIVILMGRSKIRDLLNVLLPRSAL